jgi:hypothetical protein
MNLVNPVGRGRGPLQPRNSLQGHAVQEVQANLAADYRKKRCEMVPLCGGSMTSVVQQLGSGVDSESKLAGMHASPRCLEAEIMHGWYRKRRDEAGRQRDSRITTQSCSLNQSGTSPRNDNV